MQELGPVKERIARGAALLDAVNPGWADKVNPERLDFSSSRYCLLGQLYGEYKAGLKALDLWDIEQFDTTGIWPPQRFGFSWPADTYHEVSLDYFTDMWLKEIFARRGA